MPASTQCHFSAHPRRGLSDGHRKAGSISGALRPEGSRRLRERFVFVVSVVYARGGPRATTSCVHRSGAPPPHAPAEFADPPFYMTAKCFRLECLCGSVATKGGRPERCTQQMVALHHLLRIRKRRNRSVHGAYGSLRSLGELSKRSLPKHVFYPPEVKEAARIWRQDSFQARKTSLPKPRRSFSSMRSKR